jgi:hypothetical protein
LRRWASLYARWLFHGLKFAERCLGELPRTAYMRSSRIAHLPHRPGPKCLLPGRSHNTSCGTYRILCTMVCVASRSVHKKHRRIGPGRRQEKSRAASEGGKRQARLNTEIVTRCNVLINLRICRKLAFSSRRAYALIPVWRRMGDPRVASPIARRPARHGLAA